MGSISQYGVKFGVEWKVGRHITGRHHSHARGPPRTPRYPTFPGADALWAIRFLLLSSKSTGGADYSGVRHVSPRARPGTPLRALSFRAENRLPIAVAAN